MTPMSLTPLLRLLLLLAVVTLPLRAEEEDVEAKLRQALRDTMLKLRDAQGQVAAAQASQIAAEAKVTDLTAKNDALGKELVAERNTSANMISELRTKLDERGAVITSLQASVEKWKKSYSAATAIAAKAASERNKLQARTLELERIVQAQQVKNIEMFQAGMETLDRYEKFNLGDAVLAREPFIASTRVKLQNAIQDQTDRLSNARIRPADGAQNPDSDAKPGQPVAQNSQKPQT